MFLPIGFDSLLPVPTLGKEGPECLKGIQLGWANLSKSIMGGLAQPSTKGHALQQGLPPKGLPLDLVHDDLNSK